MLLKHWPLSLEDNWILYLRTQLVQSEHTKSGHYSVRDQVRVEVEETDQVRGELGV